ncbi:MAG: sigma-70 family RNA polymerase sigma factor [Planctomycetes bacterium]|nr:sigma-70 family RNA polymerase sigma factor [Planctomycetota bacterium]
MVASLVRRVGVCELEAVEDAAQSALLKALETWTSGGLPEQPSAWVFRVAHNALMGDLRARGRRRRLLAEAPPPLVATEAEPRLPSEVEDDLLRMLFVCCDEAIPVESQLALALKTLCGFSVGEIAQRLFCNEASLYKRLARARERLRAQAETLGELRIEQCAERLPAVQGVLYLLFTEGYLLLEQVAPSALHRLNRAVAVAEWRGPQEGLAVLDGFQPPTWLAGSFSWAAVLADLHGRCENEGSARRYRQLALETAPTPALEELLRRRLDGNAKGEPQPDGRDSSGNQSSPSPD